MGGVLTDTYDWRWILYQCSVRGRLLRRVVDILQGYRARCHPPLRLNSASAQSVGLAALQLLLDRGTTKGWFSSPEIVVEAIIAGIALYLFLVHMLFGEKPFIPRAIFRDRNFVGGVVLMFVMGLVLLASSALISPYLQQLSVTVTQTGFLMVPRGIWGYGRNAVRRPPDHENGLARDYDGGRGADVVVLVGDDRLDTRRQCFQYFLGHFHPGGGHGCGFRANESGGFCDTSGTSAYRRRGTINLARNIGSAIWGFLTTTILASSIQTIHAHHSTGRWASTVRR